MNAEPEKVAAWKARIETIRSMSESPETRELCTVFLEVLKSLEVEKSREMGFTPVRK